VGLVLTEAARAVGAFPRRERDALTGAMRALAAAGLVHGTVGNGSVRCGDRLAITPSRTPYHDLDDLVVVDLEGRRVAGDRAPSRELPLHLAIHRARPDVRVVLHTHSPYATAWSFLGAPLEPTVEDLAYYGVAAVRTTAAPAAAGSGALAEGARAALGDSGAALLRGHGVIVAARTAEDAVGIAAAVEHQAHVAWLLRLDARRPASRAACR
jgi:ribulose-5-phosphate 4-epimerase/fuculose-1-phosphate aldolase